MSGLGHRPGGSFALVAVPFLLASVPCGAAPGAYADNHPAVSASGYLKAQAEKPPKLQIRWTVVKGVFDEIAGDDPDDEVASRACVELVGEFAPLIEPRPVPGCGYTGYRARRTGRVYVGVQYNDVIGLAIGDQEIATDKYYRAPLVLRPRPVPGVCAAYRAVNLIRDSEIVSTILVELKSHDHVVC